jgi:hypothetical protein
MCMLLVCIRVPSDQPLYRRKHHVVRAAKELHFNKNMEALKKMQAGADKLATVVGVTLGPKVRHAGNGLAPSHTCRSRSKGVTLRVTKGNSGIGFQDTAGSGCLCSGKPMLSLQLAA